MSAAATMDRDALSFIAHTDHPIACPVDDDTVDALLAWLDVPAGGVALDVGCGRAAWLLRLLGRYRDVRGVGVDRSMRAIAAAQARAGVLGVDDRITLVCGDAAACLPEAPVDAALCIGATQALGGLMPALARLHALLRPGGRALVGELYWQRAPTAAALAGLGAAAEDFTDVDGLVATASAAGFAPMHVECSGEGAWDRYESSWCEALERHARAHPAHPDAASMAEAARQHREAYVAGYRGVLGFAVLVLAG